MDYQIQLTTFTGTAGTTYTLRWTISNATDSIDDVDITFNAVPSAPTARHNHSVQYTLKNVSDLVATGTAIKWYDAATAGTMYTGEQKS